MKSFATFWSDEAGTAFIETLATLPVLALLLAGSVALNAMYNAKLEARSRARRIAWLQADSGGCPVDTCVGGSCRATEEEIRSEGLDGLFSARAGKLSLSSFVGDLGRFFVGEVTRSIGVAQARLPDILRSEQTSQQSTTTLLCNTSARRSESGSSVLEHACSTDLHDTEYAREVCR